jgi:enamine deaminase RidA (YjgF/YER057c/UK114 family)
MSKEYIKFFPNHKPARSAFGTTGLALGALVEIECVAYVEDH